MIRRSGLKTKHEILTAMNSGIRKMMVSWSIAALLCLFVYRSNNDLEILAAGAFFSISIFYIFSALSFRSCVYEFINSDDGGDSAQDF
jgi:hypothetical protein